ncbi:hypothetical protein [Pseudomonas sp. TE24901]
MDRRTKIAVWFTAIYLVGIALLIAFKWSEFFGLQLSALGDFLAGVFGPLALAWLVFGYFQQGDELRQGTKALKLQAQELSNSVAQQSELVAAQKESLRNYERSMEPILHISVKDADFTQDGFVIDLDLVNSGEYCESICMKLFSQHCPPKRRDLEPLINGGSRFVRFSGLHEWEDFNIVVEYKTRSGRINAQEFRFVYVNEDNSSSYEVKKQAFLN